MLRFSGIHAEILSDTTPEIDVEGARMSGKSWVCSAKVHNSCVAHPGIWWLICRYSGTETDNQLRPLFVDICRRLGTELEWHDDESAYWFPEKDGKISKVFAYGLKTQSRDQRYAKIRGSGVGGLWNDQTEETPEDIGTEMRALLRQPGYPHQLIFSPNPPDEESFIADQFPDHGEVPGRKYYHLSLYDNRHNLPADTIDRLEKAYPITHAKYKSLILGLRGPNITGTPIYEQVFSREHHVAPVAFDPAFPLLEALDVGKHHPVWVAAQRTSLGAFQVLGGLIGKRLFLEDFLPIVHQYRADWFEGGRSVKTCCDPPQTEESETGIRYTHVQAIRDLGFAPQWRDNANAPDVRESVIQALAAMMRRRAGPGQAFVLNADPAKWLMISEAMTKQTALMVDGCEASYVWDEHFISVGNKKVRQPKTDQWIDGWQRCIENLALNFIIGRLSDADRAARLYRQGQTADSEGMTGIAGPNAWLSW